MAIDNMSDEASHFQKHDIAVTQISSRRRFLLIGITCITAVIVATAGLIWMQRESSIVAFQTATTNLGNGLSQQTSAMFNSIDSTVEEIRARLPFASDTTQIQTAMRSSENRDLLVYMKRALPLVSELVLINVNGLIVNSSSGSSLPSNDFTKQDFFLQLKTNYHYDAYVSAPTKSPLTGKWIFYLARRVNDVHGTFAGIVAAEVSIAAVEDFFRVAMPAKRSLSLVREDGTVLLRYPPRYEEAGKKIPEGKAWYAAVANGGGAYRASDLFKETKIIAFVRPLNNLPLVVQASVTQSAALADLPQQIAWIVFGAIVAVFALKLLLRHMEMQVNRLEHSQSLLANQKDAIERAHIQLDAALSNISLGICLFDGEKKLIVCNQSYRRIYNLASTATETGTPYSEIIARCFATDAHPPGTAAEYLEFSDAALKPSERKQFVAELVDGRVILTTHEPMPDGGWVGTHEDITERQAADRRVKFLAQHDNLTGLANRAYFTEKLDEAVARLQRNSETFTVLFLDLDRFKNVNDTLGHAAGDQLIRETAQRLKSSLRQSDVLARLGGDEFAILQQGKGGSREDAAGLAKRILRLLADPFDLSGRKASVGISIGIALAPEHARSSSDLLKMADIALYGAKTAGRNGYLVFEASMLSAVDKRHQIEDELRLSVSRGEFELHYQPLIDAKTRRQTGFEALVRWRSPTRGLVMPDQFIRIAEETGLIVPLGEWILRQACADAANWPPHYMVAVNLSAVQLAHPDLLKTVLAALAKSSLPVERLELEITETALFKNDADSLNSIREFKRLGVSIALDDFGTGYSSLSYLTMIPFDKIKIDRYFTMNMTKRADCAAIVAGIIAIGRALNTATVAEGVETEQQFGILRAAGVNQVQGYLFGKPCPVTDLVLDDVAATNAPVTVLKLPVNTAKARLKALGVT
jgi:diguanylate cyclase (GGDEF)-like protein